MKASARFRPLLHPGKIAITLSVVLALSTLNGQDTPSSSGAPNDPDLLARLQLIETRLKEIEAAPADKETSVEESSEARLPEPEATLLLAEELAAKRNYREAYLLAKQLRGLPPEKLDAATNARACLIAAQLSGINYRMARFKEPKSIWVLTEPEATFQWVCSLEEIEDDKLRTLVATLLRNTPTQFWRRFEAFREEHFPDHFLWEIEVELDNGKVSEVAFRE